MTVAALFVAAGGVYYGLSGVEPWGLPERDARLYDGPWPVVAHPPCARWCQLAPVNQARYGHKVGNDGGCFASALTAVRMFGGVLEHPAFTHAWKAFDLASPVQGGWHRDIYGGWSTGVSQRNYGHQANKLTWLYYFGPVLPPALDWSKPAPANAWISTDRPRAELAAMGIRQLSKKEAAATPIPFRDLLLSIARSAAAREAA